MNANTYYSRPYGNTSHLRTIRKTNPNKANLKIPFLPKEREEKRVPGEKEKFVRNNYSLTEGTQKNLDVRPINLV
jgi:hypothetical protein